MEQNTPENNKGNQIVNKTCTRCNQLKNLSLFPKKTGDKLSNWCKECHRNYSKEHYRRNADEIIAKTIAWQKNNPTKVKDYLKTYRRKGRKLKIEPLPPKPPGPDDIIQNLLPVSPNNNKT